MNIIATQKQNSLQQLSNVPVSSTAQQGIDSVADVDQIISSSYTLTLGSNFNLISSLALLILRGLTLLCIDALYCGMDKEALSGGITNILKLLNAALSCIDIHPMNQIQQESITPGKINTNQETAVNQIQPTSFASQSQYQSSRVQQLKKTCSKNEQKNEIFNVLTYDTLSLSNIDGMLVVVRSALEILIQLSSFGQLMTLANPNLPKIIIAKLAVNMKPSTRIIIRDCTGKHIWDFTPVYDKFRNAYMKDVKANEEDQIRIRQQLREKELKRLKEKQISLIETSDNNSLPLFRKTDDALGNITNVLLKQKGIDIKQPILGNIDDMIAMGKEIEQSTDIQHNKENEKINIENYLTQELPPQRESVYMSNTRSILANLGIINPNVANSLAQLRLMQYDASKMIESAEERRSVNLNEFQGQLQIGQFLDSLPVRTTVEISVFYAAPNQNTVEDILGNNFASASFCAFVRGLGWEIDLSTHRGYCGSIVEPCKPAEKQFNHHTRFYYSSPTIEVIFHVCPFLAQTDGLQTIEEKTSLLQVSQTCIIWWDNSFEYDPSMLRPLGFIHQIIIRPTSFESSSISTQNQAEQTLIDPLTSINSSASFNDQQTIATEPLSNSHLFHINIDENPSFSCQYNDTLKDLTQQNPQNNQDFATDKVSIQSSIPTPLHSSLPAKNEPASGWNECYNSPFYSRSPSIFIGPLCDNVLVPPHILPILVRGTALSANRCQNIARGKQPFFDALIIRMISISRIVESSQIPFSSSEYFSSFFY
ncbi:MAG: hypothetical protein EZS28_024830 [Streblomastix strix]|uniref:Rap-GAP domain-containing protein n=1 Tax=Streblomastix strix TaxID=222440 RepID=A0A5J4VB60_9EUKA|nr:MAG: hypothetical protein EZS28_024830 [Streblomastix strix]